MSKWWTWKMPMGKTCRWKKHIYNGQLTRNQHRKRCFSAFRLWLNIATQLSQTFLGTFPKFFGVKMMKKSLKPPSSSYDCWWFRNPAFTSWGNGSLSHYLQGFIHPRWLFGISEPSTVALRVLLSLIFLMFWKSTSLLWQKRRKRVNKNNNVDNPLLEMLGFASSMLGKSTSHPTYLTYSPKPAVNNGNESHGIESVELSPNKQTTEITENGWPNSGCLTKHLLDLSSYKSQALPHFPYWTTQDSYAFFIAAFSKARGLENNKNNVDFLKWVKDDLPNSSATGFSTFNSSRVISNAMSHVSMNLEPR